MTSTIRSVVFLTYHFPPEVGGIQTRISKYVEKLSKRGIHVSVLVAGRNPEASKFGGVQVRLVSGGMKRLPRNAAIITRQVIGSRADAVHVFTGSSTLLGLYTLILARMVGARAVISVFGREDFVFERLSPRILLRLSMKLADSIDVNSPATGVLLPRDVKPKIHVLLGAAEESTISSDAGSGEAVLLFVGRLVQRKGVDDFLRAFTLIRPRFPNARLSIVGDGPEKENLTALAERLNVSDSVEFKGKLVGAELDREYARCVAFILPSKDVATDPANEGLGLALIEASMHGKPLVGTRHGGIPEVVKDGENGLLVPPADPTSLGAALIRILSDHAMAETMGKEALNMARSRFSWDRATDVLLQSYE